LTEAGKRYADAVERFTFYQFVFFRQWSALREHANQRGIKIIGDLPIFVAYDSADVWANPEQFYLDKVDQPSVVAGVPPDYFSKTGQLWGNPLYRWDVLRAADYDWWIARFRAALKQVDIVRLDHFRGFAGYWEVFAGSKTAEKGRWVPGPGEHFLSVVKTSLGELPIIAEDLGEITPDVIELRDQFELPGMKILQFAFSGAENPFLPHNYPTNCVTYTGTHDNDTANGWYETAPDGERDFAHRYLETDGSNFAWDLVRAAWSSVAVYAIAPMQDLLGLGTEARMNFPSTLGGNWSWRLDASALSDQLGDKLRELNYLYRR
jgi:4-alpha-glucanotransferase